MAGVGGVGAGVALLAAAGGQVAVLAEQPARATATSEPAMKRLIARMTGRGTGLAGPVPRPVRISAVRLRIVIFWLPLLAPIEPQPHFGREPQPLTRGSVASPTLATTPLDARPSVDAIGSFPSGELVQADLQPSFGERWPIAPDGKLRLDDRRRATLVTNSPSVVGGHSAVSNARRESRRAVIVSS